MPFPPRLVPGLAVALAAAVAQPTLSHAQVPVSTGTNVTAGRDLAWQVSTNNGSTWSDAFVVTSPPGQWTAGAPGGIWISASASGSGGGGAYRIRTIFSSAVAGTLAFDYRCAVDNNPATFWINGVAAGTPCPDLWFWGSVNNVSSAVSAGSPITYEFRWSGDNTTDGMAVQVTNARFTPGTPVSTVPEPSTYALLAAGLVGLAVAARRRR